MQFILYSSNKEPLSINPDYIGEAGVQSRLTRNLKNEKQSYIYDIYIYFKVKHWHQEF